MITASIFSAPEVVWSALVAAVGGVGTGAAKVIHLDHKVKALEAELEETKSDFKDDLTYLRDRMDKVVEHLLENKNV